MTISAMNNNGAAPTAPLLEKSRASGQAGGQSRFGKQLAEQQTVLPLGQSGNSEGVSGTVQHLGQKDYLKLMTAQFLNQDPTHPIKNGQFLGQLAQFGTVSGIRALKQQFAQLANAMQTGQTLRAASLIGHDVLVAKNSAKLGEDGVMTGSVNVPPGGGNVRLIVSNRAGEPVKQIDLGTVNGGLVDFSWHGETARGESAPAGTYTINAQLVGDRRTKALPTYMEGQIKSVRLGDRGNVTLSVAGLGDVDLNDIRQVSG